MGVGVGVGVGGGSGERGKWKGTEGGEEGRDGQIVHSLKASS